MAKPQNPKAVQNEAPKPESTAAPGTVDPAGAAEEKASKVKKELYPALVDPANPDGYEPLTVVPENWDPKVHKGILRKHFAEDDVFFDWRASRLEKQAASYRQQAEESRKLGSMKGRVKAKKLLSMQKRIADLKASLAAEGVDVAALLASIEPADG